MTQTTPDGARLLPPGPFTRWPRAADTVLAVALFMFLVLVEFEEPSGDVAPRALGDLSIVVVLVIAAACGALIWRRSQPLVVLGVTLTASTVSVPLGARGDPRRLPLPNRRGPGVPP